MPTSSSNCTLTQAQSSPWDTSFYTLMRTLSACHPDYPPAGYARRPQDEPFRLGQSPSLVFAPREVDCIDATTHPPHISLFSLGMLGPDGPLPLHFTEMVKDRQDIHGDATLRHFMDMFHHRAMVLHYRAWADAQAAAGLDRPDSRFIRYISQLSGVAQQDDNGILPDHARLSLAPLLCMAGRPAGSLSSAISHYFGVPADVEEYTLHYLPLPAEDKTVLGSPLGNNSLGTGAVLGDSIPDCQHHFRLVLGPMSLADYQQFLNPGHALSHLIALIRAFTGIEYEWDLLLLVRQNDIPSPQLGTSLQLGRSAWIGQCTTHAVPGKLFTPEATTGN